MGVPPAQQVQAVVGGDAVEPGAHRRLGLEAVGVLIDLEKDLLQGVFRLQGVFQQAVGHLVETALVAADEFRQGGLVSPGHPPE